MLVDHAFPSNPQIKINRRITIITVQPPFGLKSAPSTESVVDFRKTIVNDAFNICKYNVLCQIRTRDKVFSLLIYPQVLWLSLRNNQKQQLHAKLKFAPVFPQMALATPMVLWWLSKLIASGISP